MKYIIPFEQISLADISLVGGKNASIGEMISSLSSCGIKVPGGFALTTNAYIYFLNYNNVKNFINERLSLLSREASEKLHHIGKEIREKIRECSFPLKIENELRIAYRELEKKYGTYCDVAIRSSATAEDSLEASFAGQQDSYLNIQGENKVITTCLHVYASLFSDRAILYRLENKIEHSSLSLSIGIQKMVRADQECSGVLFTADTESGFNDVIVITSSYGLGEAVVGGKVNPDEFYVHKKLHEKNFLPLLKKRLGSKEWMMVNDQEKGTRLVPVSPEQQQKYSLSNDAIITLASYALTIEKHYSSRYGTPIALDIEWAQENGEFYILQARPETVHSSTKKNNLLITEYKPSFSPAVIPSVVGKSIGTKIVHGKVRILQGPHEMHLLEKGEILVTDITDPDWLPIMKKAVAVITNRGGRTCHAAIVSRELDIPAAVGCSNATSVLSSGMEVTLDCSRGDVAYIYPGHLPFEVATTALDILPSLPVKIMMNLADPNDVFSRTQLPNDGVGLTRLEFIISNNIQIHPMALLYPYKVTVEDRKKIAARVQGYDNSRHFFIDVLAQEAGTIAAAFYPKPVIIRFSDFKSNEYRELIGGYAFEPLEENPMIGFRGASRYYHALYREAFALECAAIKKMREEMGLFNIKCMIPFVRTLAEAKSVLEELKTNGLERGKKGLEIIMMCELPSNVILLDQFSAFFDGFSIGSNDLTQTLLAVDRDSHIISHLFDEQNEAVKIMILQAIEKAHRNGKPIGICGEAPSDSIDFARFLIENKIDSMSLSPSRIISTLQALQ